MTQSHFKAVYNIFEMFINEARHNAYREGLNPNGDDFRLSAPQFWIDLFIEGCQAFSMVYLEIDREKPKFMGVLLIPSHANELAFFHVDYPLTRRPGQIYKLALDTPAEQHNGMYSTYIVALTPLVKMHFHAPNPHNPGAASN